MDMSKDYMAGVGYVKPTGRITRARATACRGTGDMLPLLPPPVKSDHITQRNSKREAMDRYIDAALPVASGYKRRTVFKDITNKRCDNSHTKCIDATKKRSKNSQKAELIPSKATLGISKKDSTLESAVSVENALPEEGARIMMDEQIRAGGVFKSKQTTVSVTLEEDYRAQHNIQDRESTGVAAQLDKFSFREALKITCHSRNVNDNNSNDEKSLTDRDYIDIDSDHNNPQMCSLYSPDIYTNLLAAELNQRPCSNFMETMQGDITQSMRGILIDWLVEVSEEYKLVPDTLYLTVYIIDQFLSGNYIERQRLQLLGITCMLIASKYEEICAPHVEELCFITDNTYTKENVPKLSLEFLANYLAELTLIEYNFLKFLPSIIAASSVFLARWTLDQSSKPWNLTLEYYTSYKASDLKATVLAMQDLRINVKNCPLNAVREKYRQLKFKSVETLPSQTLLPTLFCDTLPILPQSECC